ncbi:hypothetical protein Tco_1198121 [Tanacetum coccineum]
MLCSACSSSFYTSSFAFSLTWDVLAVSVQYLQSNPSPLYVLSSSQPLKGFVGLSVLTGKGVIRAGTYHHALGRAVDYGMQGGLAAGHEHEVARTPLSAVVAYNPETAERNYLDAVRALEEADFPLVHLLKSKKDSGMDEVLDCFLFDGPLADLPKAAHLQPCLEQLFVPNYHADVNVVVRETSLSFALLNVHTRGEGAKRHASALRQLMVDIVSHPLSSQNLLGEASTR